MAVIITADDLAAEGITGSLVPVWLEFVNQADDCLDAHNVPEATQRIMKLALIKHLFTLDQGGQLTSRHAPSGASQSFASPSKAGSTAALDTLRALDKYGCLFGLVNSSSKNDDETKLFIGSFGPGRRRCR